MGSYASLSVRPSVCPVSLDQNSRPGSNPYLKQLACFQAFDQQLCWLNKHADVIAVAEMYHLMRSKPLHVLGSMSVYSESQLQSVDGSSMSLQVNNLQVFEMANL